LAAKSPIYYVGKNQTLSDAIKVFASTGARRLLVVENSSDTRNPVNILTQSTVNTYLSNHLDKLGDLGKKTIQEESLGIKSIVSVDLNAPAIEAFKLIAEHRVTGVAVLEEDKTLFTIISAKDIKVRIY
jgi:CBS domain-containing protein